MIYILDISPALTVLPYALLYYALLLFSCGLALLTIHSSKAAEKSALKIALVFIFSIQLILLTVNLLAYQGVDVIRTLFPLVHRSLNLICLVWLIWAIFKTRDTELPEWPPAVMSLLILLAAIFFSLWWLPFASEQTFNQSWMDILWSSFTLGLILVAAIGYIIKFRNDVFYAVLTLGIAALGFLLYIFLPSPGSLPAVVMLSQLFYYPLLIGLSTQVHSEEEDLSPLRTLMPEDKNELMRANLANAFLNLSVQPNQEKVEKALSHTVSLYLMSDLLGLVSYTNGETSAYLKNTYDLIREDYLATIELPANHFPGLLKALAESEPIIANNKSELQAEKQALMHLSGYNQIGNLLFYPINSSDNQAGWALLGLTPYTNKNWEQSDLKRLDQLKQNLGKVLEKASLLEQNSLKISSLQSLLAAKQDENQRLDQDLQSSRTTLKDLSENLKETQIAWTEEVALWISRQKDLETELDSLQKTIEENQKSMAQIDLLREQKQQLEETIAHNSEQANQLKTAIEQAKQLINQLAFPDSSTQNTDNEHWEDQDNS